MLRAALHLSALLLLLVGLGGEAVARWWGGGDEAVRIDLDHVFHGRINRRGDAVGFHHRPGGQDPEDARLVALISPPDRNGVYRGRVEIRDPSTGAWVDKRVASTFFPDGLSREEVIAAIRHGFAAGERQADGKFVGPSGLGFDIEGWYQSGRIAAAYPLQQRGRDRR